MDIKERLRRINANSFYGVGPIDRDRILKEVEEILRRKKMAEMNNNAVNAYINEIIRKEKEYTEKSLAEIVEKYDFMVCSTECMNQLQEILPEGAKIAYSPYIGDPSTIYVIKRFDVMDLLNKAIEEEQYAAEDKEWGSLEERIGKEES